MANVLHGSARTTPRIRAELQASKESSRALAARYGLNPKTVLKWRKRTTTADAPMGPSDPRSTVLTPAEEAIIVEFRRRTLLPLDDVLGCLMDTIPNLSRSALHRCLQRHGISRLPADEAKEKRGRFKTYEIGYIHIDSCELRHADGRLVMFLAIDRVSKFTYVEFHDHAGKMDGSAFLRNVVQAFPYQIHTVLTDNGMAFADLPKNRYGPGRRFLGPHIFDRVCIEHGIEHRLTKPYHPWTNGQAERMNRTIKDATVKVFHYDNIESLKAHVLAFVTAYNFAKHLKALRWRTPYQAICDAWTNDPSTFKINPHHLIPRPHLAGRPDLAACRRGRQYGGETGASMTMIDTTARAAATKAAPVAARDRIETLDILRGFAVLGILAVNAIAFAWPGTMDASSATAPFSMEGPNRVAVWVVDVFFHNKCRTLFSMLFGVSIFLVGGEKNDRARGALLQRRLLVLAAFGLIHGLALWFGDILLLYAWCGVFMMLCRSWTPKRLLWVGCLLVGAFSVISILGEGAVVLFEPASDPAKFAQDVEKGRAAVLATVDIVRSGYAGAMVENLKTWALVQGLSVTMFVFPTIGLMMIGLGLFKSGYLAGRSPSRTYLGALILGAIITTAFGVTEWLVLDPGQAPKLLYLSNVVLDALAPFVTLAWVGLLVLLTRHGAGVLTRRLAPVGRMAFTNYLTQTILMASIFYMPWGPHLYGRVEPAGLWGIVVGVWLLQLIWSPLWLSRFEMGPLEWVWRSLTYGRCVPMLKAS